MAVKFDSNVMNALFGEVWDKPPVPVKKKETETFSLTGTKETLYKNPHRVKLTGNRLEIRGAEEPLSEATYPRDFEELIEFMDAHGITAKETADGLLITGGTGEQHQSVIASLNSSIWIYGNLRLYLSGELRDIDGRKYKRFRR